MRPNRSFDTDTHRQGTASRAPKHTSRGALPVRAGQLRRWAAPGAVWLSDGPRGTISPCKLLPAPS